MSSTMDSSLIAGDRRDLELRLRDVGEELLVLHRGHERLAQGVGAILGHAGRRHIGTSHHLPAEDQPQDLPLLVVARQVHHQRHVRQVGVLGERELHQQVEALVAHPVLMRGLDGRPWEAATAEHLAALHRDVDLGAAGIAGDHLELGAEHVVEDRGELIGVVGGAAGADDELALLHVGLNVVIPEVCHAMQTLTSSLALPTQVILVGSYLRGLVAEQRLERHGAAGRADHGAVLRRRAVEASWRRACRRRPACCAARPWDCRECACP